MSLQLFIKMKMHFQVRIPILSNQDRELIQDADETKVELELNDADKCQTKSPVILCLLKS